MENMQEFTQEQNIKGKNQIYNSTQSEHSLIIHQIPTNSAQQQQKLHRCLDHVRQLTRTRKWKHKGGRDSSHSYWSWTHGPRGTTHGTYRRRPWLWMVSRRGFSFWQGAGAAPPGSPDLDTAAAETKGLPE